MIKKVTKKLNQSIQNLFKLYNSGMRPNLTIIIPSYNRGEYIEECLNSIFNQKTKYSYKIIVADDCSTDNTLEILEKYKDKIQILKSDKNQKLYKNILRAYEIVDTDYFCVLDPDDFWIDESKIEEALDFLEKNKDYTIYTTNSYKQNDHDNNSREDFVSCFNNQTGTFNDFLDGRCFFGWTGSTIFRNVIFKDGLPDKMKNASGTQIRSFRGDSFRNIIHLERGKVFASEKFSAVYRQTRTGIWAGINKFYQNILDTRAYIDFYEFFDEKYDGILYYSNIPYKELKKNLYSFLSKEESLEELKEKLEEFNEIEKFYEAHKEIFDKINLKGKKPKYRLYFAIYNKLLKKLKKKGIVL